MLARNSLFARFANSAASLACCSSSRLASRSAITRAMTFESPAISSLKFSALSSLLCRRLATISRRDFKACSRESSSMRRLLAVRCNTSKVGRNSSGTSSINAASAAFPSSRKSLSKLLTRSRVPSQCFSGNQMMMRPPTRLASAKPSAARINCQRLSAIRSAEKARRNTP